MNHILLIVTTLILSAFFSGMEIAYISANKLRIELDRKHNIYFSRILAVFVNNPGKFLTTLLVGNNIALVIYGIVMAGILEPLILRISDSSVVVLILQTVLSTLLILITAEFLPKIIFRTIPNTALNMFSVPATFFYVLFYPVTSLINWLSEKIIHHFSKEVSANKESKKVFNKIDLAHLIRQSQKIHDKSAKEDNDLKIFRNALDFSNVKVRDCMVPRTEIKALEMGCTIHELQQSFIDTGFSKILIYKDTIDNITGYITSKLLFKKIKSIEDHVLDVSFVPETMPANKLLEKLFQDKRSLAVVVDEFGGVSGILTIEDVLEEIFGEIEDEHDTVELIEKKINADEFIFSGRMEIDSINEKYGLELPENEDYETLAGFIIHHYENIPKLNERIHVGSFDIKILKASNIKIDLVHIKRINS